MTSSTETPRPRSADPNRLGVGRFKRHDSSFFATTVSLAPNRYVPTPSHLHLSPTGVAHGQPLIPVDVEPSVPVDELPLPTNSINEQPAPTNVRELVPPTNSQPALTSLQSGFTEVELATPGNIVQEASIAPSWAIHKATFVLFGLCVAVAIATTGRGGISPSLLQASLSEIIGGVGAKFTILIDIITPILGWVAFASTVDCAIPSEGGRIISELTSPGLGDSQPWLYRTVLGLTAVPADAVLDPHLPHWAFLGDSGYITLQLHSNATISTIIVESDFVESIPHHIRVWAFVPKTKRGHSDESLLVTPPLLDRFEDRGLFPIFLGNISLGEDSVPGGHRYHVHSRIQALTPAMVVMLEFLSNGGSNITRIRLIRILGIPSSIVRS